MEKCLAALHSPWVVPTPQGTGLRTGTQDNACSCSPRGTLMQAAGRDLLQLPSGTCSPPREGLSGHRASGEAQSMEADSSFQPIGHQGWLHVQMPIPSLPN